MCQQSSDSVPLAVVLSLLRGISDKLAVGRSPGHLTKALPCYLGVPPTFHPWSTHLLPLFCSYLFPSSSHLLPTCMAIFSLCSWIFSFPLFPSVFCPSFPYFLPCSAHAWSTHPHPMFCLSKCPCSSHVLPLHAFFYWRYHWRTFSYDFRFVITRQLYFISHLTHLIPSPSPFPTSSVTKITSFSVRKSNKRY